MVRSTTVPVRLTEEEKNQILCAVEAVASKNHFDWVRISLFGSRTNLKVRGGDIDLYVEVKPIDADKADPKFTLDLWKIKQQLRIKLQDLLGEQKIDIILDDLRENLGPFGELIKKQKVDLWTKT